MRTTVDVNDALLRLAKRQAAAEGSTLRAVIERALRSHLHRSGGRASYRLKWSTERGRLLPGAVIEDRDALFDLMDGRR